MMGSNSGLMTWEIMNKENIIAIDSLMILESFYLTILKQK